jgi:predicted nucleic-acid-binding protein
MISLDTNVIARFYVDDPSDTEALKQRPLARQVFEQGDALFVPLTVVLELEWVLRAFYEFAAPQFLKVVLTACDLGAAFRSAIRFARSCAGLGFCRCAAPALERTLREYGDV